MTLPVQIILSQSRHSGDPAAPDDCAELAKLLAARCDAAITVVPHLYDVVAGGPTAQFLRAAQGNLIVLAALFPRATYGTLQMLGVAGQFGAVADRRVSVDRTAPMAGAPSPRTIWCLDLRRHHGPEACLEEVLKLAGAAGEKRGQSPFVRSTRRAVPANGDCPLFSLPPARIDEPVRPRWYPVIDLARCTNCLECLSFCLFGVYDVDAAARIAVAQPDACRAGCPACSRICPEAAIMFPGHGDGAIAGDATAAPQALKLDLSQLMSGSDPRELAAAERAAALAEGDRPLPPTADPLDKLVDDVEGLDL